MSALTASFSRLSLSSRSNVRGTAIAAPRPSVMSTCARRCAVIVEATGKASVEKTYRVSLRNRARNKARKSAIATRMKKVFTALESSKESAKTEADIKDVEVLISEAFSEIDKAVVKGALHKSTAARRKARLSAAKNKFLAAAGAA